MIRLMVVDDHSPTREKVIKELTSGDLIDVIAEAATSDEAWQTAKELLPDIVLLDLHLPGFLTTEDLLQRLNTLPNVKVVIFASKAKASEVQDWLESGAHGYVLKQDQSALVRMSILMVSRGSQGVISPSLPRHLTRLTPDERSILRHLTKRGKLPKAAQRIGISEESLTSTAEHLAAKLEIDSIEKLIKWAKKHGF
ncbi:MAG: response regulator transcription factor [Candidatus Obscuribacterales bacterium]|nr:response regulator transcription factor [Candidatus Obscuribacterales bacterium]